MTSWSDQFGVGATLESTDGATYDVIKPVVDPQAPKFEEPSNLHVPSLAEQLAARKAEEDEEYRQRHRNLPPKPLDEDEAFFLEAIQREALIKEDLKRKQEQKDIKSFNNALQNRVIQLNDDKVIPIDLQINKETFSKNKSSDIVVAPNVHDNNKTKIDLDGVVLLKKVKKKKKKKKKKCKIKVKHQDNVINTKKRKLNDLETDDTDSKNKKRRKLNTEDNVDKTKLSEWERDID